MTALRLLRRQRGHWLARLADSGGAGRFAAYYRQEAAKVDKRIAELEEEAKREARNDVINL